MVHHERRHFWPAIAHTTSFAFVPPSLFTFWTFFSKGSFLFSPLFLPSWNLFEATHENSMQTIDAHAMLDALALFDAPAVVEVPAGIVAARRAPPILPRDMQSLVELTLRHNQPLTSPPPAPMLQTSPTTTPYFAAPLSQFFADAAIARTLCFSSPAAPPTPTSDLRAPLDLRAHGGAALIRAFQSAGAGRQPRREELSPLYQLAGGVAPWGNQRASSHRRRPCRRGLPRRTHP